MKNHIGPKTYTIVKTTCLYCEFHKSVLTKSGKSPEREYFCSHKSLKDQNVATKVPLYNDKPELGTFIGNNEDTPTWCPYLSGPLTKEKIENLLKNLELENSGYDDFIVTDIKWNEDDSCTIDFDIKENGRGTMGYNKIKISPTLTRPKIIVSLCERFEGGGDEEIIEEAILKLLTKS